MTLRLQFKTMQPQVVHRVRELIVSEDDLQERIDGLDLDQDDLCPTARDLLDYLDGRGEFASIVELGARHEEVREIMEGIAHAAYCGEYSCREVHIRLDEADEQAFSYHDARCERS